MLELPSSGRPSGELQLVAWARAETGHLVLGEERLPVSGGDAQVSVALSSPAGALALPVQTEGEVTLDVFDITGRLVDRVTTLPRGDGVMRTAPWFADDRIAAGVYFAVLKAGGQEIAQKIVVAK